MACIAVSPFEIPHDLAACTSDQIEIALPWLEHDNRIAREGLRHPYVYANEKAAVAA